MSENNVKTLRPADARTEDAPSFGNGGEDFKEMKTLVWMGIISVWITLGLLLFIGSGNYRNSQAIQALNDPERFTAVLEDIATLRQEVVEIETTIGSAAGDLESQVAGVTETLRSELTANAAATREILAQITEGQSRINGRIQAARDRLTESVAQGFDRQRRLVGDGQDQLQASFDRLAKEQQAVLEAVRSDNLQNTERRQILKQFFQNQTALLEKLSATFTAPAGGKTAQ